MKPASVTSLRMTIPFTIDAFISRALLFQNYSPPGMDYEPDDFLKTASIKKLFSLPVGRFVLAWPI